MQKQVVENNLEGVTQVPNTRYLQFISTLFRRPAPDATGGQNGLRNVPKLASPQSRKKLLKELNTSQLLGQTPDGKEIYLCDYAGCPAIIKELGRLREMSFRAVGEGTMCATDIDIYDRYYRHIVLWDRKELEIAGAYRIGEAYKLVKRYGLNSLYTSELFEYSDKFEPYFAAGIELGRSFIQPRYWGKRSLDYLWLGIGAYLNAHPQVRYAFGAVSLSNDYPEFAKQQIVGCYAHFFSPQIRHQQGLERSTPLARAKMPYRCDRSVLESYRDQSWDEALKSLQQSLRRHNLSLPTLYKHYTELCDPEGVQVIDFNIDPGFSYCVDGLMLVDLHHIRPKKHDRYIAPHAAAAC